MRESEPSRARGSSGDRRYTIGVNGDVRGKTGKVAGNP
jgi:hypothetical protein